MVQHNELVYAVPTHLREREPFAFGRTVGEVARLAIVGFVAARLVGSDDLPALLRLPAAALVLVIGTAWALMRVQRRPLDWWLGLAFRYGALPRRRVWRSSGAALASAEHSGLRKERSGWYALQRVRVRWADSRTDAHDGLAVSG